MPDSEATTQRYRVGYALEPKKFESFLQPSLLNHTKQHGIDLVQIDPTTPLHSQAPFHCIIHKLYTQQWRKQLQEFSAENPNTIIIDPPESVDQLHNRVSMLESATQLELRISPENATVGVPKQVVVNDPKTFRFDQIEEMGLRFPVIAKPVAANGTDGSHQLCLVFDRDGVNALTAPVVLQEFVNHGGVVFKVYVAGQRVICVKRKSLPDISEEKLRMLKGSVPFSQVSNLSEEGGGSGGGGGGAVENGEVEMPSEGLVEELGRGLREALGLHLFNVDLIRNGRDQRRYLVIDINYFPGYAKLPDYEPFFTNFLLDILQDKKTA